MAFAIPTPQDDEFKKRFEEVDSNHDGKISVKELQQALSKGTFEFSASTTQKIMNMFDRDRSGQLSFTEFKQVHDFITKMANAFRVRDKSGDGILSGEEVRAALAESGYVLSDAVFQLLMRKHDQTQRGGLQFDDYIEVSTTISTSRNVFAYYDKAKTNSVNFNYDSFLGAVLSCS
jgi:Ca2+-binding EF-hand superfamily protein